MNTHEVDKISHKVDVVVIGAGQAGLSAAYYLKKAGLESVKGFVVLDDEDGAGGAWRNRWDSLRLSNVNGIHDLPGMKFEKALETSERSLQANQAVPFYYKTYEEKFELPIIRPVQVQEVIRDKDRFLVKTNGTHFSASGIINATGTWKTPYCPKYPGWEVFEGIQLHTAEYKSADDFKGKHVIVVGGGISAVQLLEEIAQVTETTWVTRKKPDFRPYTVTQEKGREAVAMVEERVRKGLPPKSVVSVTGLPLTPAIQGLIDKDVMYARPMFDEITNAGVRWADGTELKADVIFWNTGFKHSLKHLDPLQLKNEKGGIEMSGRLATQVKREPRVHLVGYGPSASTIGANRAGRVGVQELLDTLQIQS